MPNRMLEIMSEFMPDGMPERMSVEKRAADVIAILALLSSCCLVAHLESQQLWKMLRGSLETK